MDVASTTTPGSSARRAITADTWARDASWMTVTGRCAGSRRWRSRAACRSAASMPVTWARSRTVRSRSATRSGTRARFSASRSSTITRPSRSKTTPRGARRGRSRRWLFPARSRYPECRSICTCQKAVTSSAKATDTTHRNSRSNLPMAPMPAVSWRHSISASTGGGRAPCRHRGTVLGAPAPSGRRPSRRVRRWRSPIPAWRRLAGVPVVRAS